MLLMVREYTSSSHPLSIIYISNHADSIIRVIAYRQHIVASFLDANSLIDIAIVNIDIIKVTV